MEVRTALRTVSAKKDEITGFRKYTSRNDHWIKIYLQGRMGVRVYKVFTGDAAFAKWLKGIQEL